MAAPAIKATARVVLISWPGLGAKKRYSQRAWLVFQKGGDFEGLSKSEMWKKRQEV